MSEQQEIERRIKNEVKEMRENFVEVHMFGAGSTMMDKRNLGETMDNTITIQLNEAINKFDNEVAEILRQSESTPNGAPDAKPGTPTPTRRVISIANAIEDRLGEGK